MATQYFTAVTNEEFEALLSDQTYPHQLSPLWDDYTETLSERELWQGTRWVYDPQDGNPKVALTLRLFTLRRMRFLWLQDGPVWVGATPSAVQEAQFLDRLRTFVRDTDGSIDFIRLNAFNVQPILTVPCQDLFFHDTTVVVSLEGDEAALLSRMKKRGRRDLSKAQRTGGVEVRDCTNATREEFESYLDIMDETSERQNFNSLSRDQYWNFVTTLRAAGALRLFVGFIDGKAVNWGLYTVHNGRAQYEVAAGNDQARQSGAANIVMWHAMCEFQKAGIRELDLVAIGSEYNPRLNSLNLFKTQWTKETTFVGQPMELVIHPLKYRLMNALARVMGR